MLLRVDIDLWIVLHAFKGQGSILINGLIIA